ncbi:MAG: LemA family protein [Thermodesulfovibrionia bacterium]|nr:LemA family protein [Thermodesulfovibrionia bacterium]
MSKGLKITLIVVGVIVVIGIMMAKWIIGGYNNAIAMDENVKGSWAQVENQLKRRYDLIPNLVETVKGYATHEKELFEHIADARTKYFSAGSVKEKINASNQLEGVLSRLLMLNEQYPQLKANENFMKLQDSLEGTENRIAVERMRYNEAVQLLNTYIRTFFGRFFAGLAGVTNAEYYELPEGEGAVPKVKF